MIYFMKDIIRFVGTYNFRKLIRGYFLRWFLRFFSGSLLLIFLVFCVVLICVFTFWVPCCDVCYDFRIKTMFGSSLPPVVCWGGWVSCLIYVICVCLCIVVSNTCCVVFLSFFLSSSCAAIFSGLSIFDDPSVFSNVCFWYYLHNTRETASF